MSNTKNFSEIAVGEVFILRTFYDSRDSIFIKIVTPNGKYAALLYNDFLSLSKFPSRLISGNFEIYTNCKDWQCELVTSIDARSVLEKETSPKDEEVEKLTLCDIDDKDITTLKVTKKQREAIEYLFNAGLLLVDKIMINKPTEIIDLT